MLQLVPLLAVVTLALGTGDGDTRVRLRLQPPLAIRSDNRRIFSSHQPRSDIYLSTYLLLIIYISCRTHRAKIESSDNDNLYVPYNR